MMEPDARLSVEPDAWTEQLEDLRARWRQGDRAAAGDALALCLERSPDVPTWVKDWYLTAWKGRLSGTYLDLEDAFFGRRLDGGHHADPIHQRYDYERDEDALACDRAAQHGAYRRGRSRWAAGAALFYLPRQNGTERLTDAQIKSFSNLVYDAGARDRSFQLHTDPLTRVTLLSGQLHQLRSDRDFHLVDYLKTLKRW